MPLQRKGTGQVGELQNHHKLNGPLDGMSRKESGMMQTLKNKHLPSFRRLFSKRGGFELDEEDIDEHIDMGWTAKPKIELNWKALYSKAGLDRTRR